MSGPPGRRPTLDRPRLRASAAAPAAAREPTDGSAMTDDQSGILGKMPRSRPGTRSTKRGGNQAADDASPAGAQTETSRRRARAGGSAAGRGSKAAARSGSRTGAS